MKASEREKILEQIIRDTLWMARRYANRRSTFTPSTVNESIDLAIKMGIDIKPDTVDGIEMYALDGTLGKWNAKNQTFEGETLTQLADKLRGD